MADIKILTQFFRHHGGRPKEDFLEEFDGAFLLGRFRNMTPLLVFLPRDESFKLTLGSDEDCDFEVDADPTLDPVHAEFTYHAGFKGWMISDLKTSFGTHVDGDRLGSDRATLLRDRSVIKPGGGLTELQLYTASTLYGRMTKAGITRSLRRKKKKKKGGQPKMEAQEAKPEEVEVTDSSDEFLDDDEKTPTAG